MAGPSTNLTPEHIIEMARKAEEDLAPTKSKKLYEVAYEKFINWCAKNKIENYTESVLIAYFSHIINNLHWKNKQRVLCRSSILRVLYFSLFIV